MVNMKEMTWSVSYTHLDVYKRQYLNHALVQERLKISEKVFESYREEASLYAGPAVIEVFGEKLFSPKVKKESPAYKKEQEELSVSYRRDYSLLQNRYIPVSYTHLYNKTKWLFRAFRFLVSKQVND